MTLPDSALALSPSINWARWRLRTCKYGYLRLRGNGFTRSRWGTLVVVRPQPYPSSVFACITATAASPLSASLGWRGPPAGVFQIYPELCSKLWITLEDSQEGDHPWFAGLPATRSRREESTSRLKVTGMNERWNNILIIPLKRSPTLATRERGSVTREEFPCKSSHTHLRIKGRRMRVSHTNQVSPPPPPKLQVPGGVPLAS